MKNLHAALLCALAFAASLTASLAENDIAFAIPEEGFVTLGVFDNNGHLVRTLHVLKPEENFRKGLNGLITEWDGRDDTGKRLPSGHYHIRGYLVPTIPVEGVAYHFNDWLAEPNAPSVSWIDDFAVLDDNSLMVTGKSPAGTLVCTRHDQERGFVWSTPLEGQSSALIAILQQTVLVKTSTAWHFLALSDGTPSDLPSPTISAAAVDAFATLGNEILIAHGDRLERFPSESPAQSIPRNFTSLTASGNMIVGASVEGVFISSDASRFEKLPLPVLVSSLSTVGDSTFWFTGTAMDPDTTPLVAQADTTGAVLRMLSIDRGFPTKVRALPDDSGFFVLEQSGDSQSMRLIRKGDGNAWEILWERTIQMAPAFGISDGSVVPNIPSGNERKTLRVRLTKNPLTGEHGDISLSASHGPKGTFLVTEDGLPLVLVSERGDITRAVIDRGSVADSLRLLQGNGAGAEEFLIQGLGGIIPLNVGGIDLP